MTTFVGFDSAWTDNAKAPGAICALEIDSEGQSTFHSPSLASFSDALAFIRNTQSTDGPTLIALDQPTIVPNPVSSRPVEKSVSSLIGWLGGGVQPSNRGRKGMFCDQSPIWRFLTSLGATENPELARTAEEGLHLFEVFPALALPSLHSGFFGRLAAPKYNPGRKTFRLSDWQQVTKKLADEFTGFGQSAPAQWCLNISGLAKPQKSDQDQLDAMICLLISMRWRLRPRSASLVLGCKKYGYMVVPVSLEVRKRLEADAAKWLVPIDAFGNDYAECKLPAENSPP